MKNIQLSKINYFGNYSEIVSGARFDGYEEIPIIEAPKKIVIPTGITPFSQRHRAPSYDEAIGFFENDENFIDLLLNPLAYVDELKKFSAVCSPDFTLFRDAPLENQIENINRNRALGYFLQKHGVNVYAAPRWGSAETFMLNEHNERFALLGVPKNSIVVIGTYGCVKNINSRRIMTDFIRVMMDYLTPKIVLVYGPMPKSIFEEFEGKALFKQYSDWTSRLCKGGDLYGKHI